MNPARSKICARSLEGGLELAPLFLVELSVIGFGDHERHDGALRERAGCVEDEPAADDACLEEFHFVNPSVFGAAGQRNPRLGGAAFVALDDRQHHVDDLSLLRARQSANLFEGSLDFAYGSGSLCDGANRLGYQDILELDAEGFG